MMKSKLLILVSFFTMAKLSTAENVTVHTAQSAAQAFLNSKTDGNQGIHLIDFAEKAFFPNFYVFGNEQCFVIIASDNAVHPVLGYSIENGFGMDRMPIHIYEWLKAYDEEIAIVTENRLGADNEIQTEWDNLLNGLGLVPKSRSSVDPLLKTKWNQDAPFNDLCPTDSTAPNGHCYSGCVATVMAQIMNYWENPVRGTGTHSYVPQTHPEYGAQSANFGSTTYDWDNMKNYYARGYTDVEALAVATLVYHCGVSVNINYGPSSTGGRLQNAVYALSHYFNYSSSIVYKSKSNEDEIYYSDSLWTEMLKQELDLERPVPYRGIREEGNVGHSFVCDGYDENDYFHFNWGWSGRCDGYFIIGALNPQRNHMESQNNRAYNRNNAAIFNCYPKTPNINPPSSINSVVNGRNVTITWSNVNDAAYYKLYRDSDLIANNLHSTSYIDNNVTFGLHSYYVKSVKSDGIMSLKSNTTVADVHFPGPTPSNLQALVSGQNVNLSWQTQNPENAILQYGTGSEINGVGYDGGTFWAHRYPITTLCDFAGMAIEKVACYFRTAGNYTVSIYKGDISNPIELIYQQSYNASAGSWQDVVFSSPVIIDYTKDLWIVFYSEANNPASYCSFSSTGVEDASLYSQTGQSWNFLTDRSWLIKTYITEGTYTYTLYRDGNAVVNNINGNTWTNNNVPVGFYDYHVTTNYFCGESDPSNTIRVRVGNPPCSVSAIASPTNGGTVTGNGIYNYGQTCTLTASPATGYDFINWTKNGTPVSTNTSYSFTVTEETSTYVAHFQLQSFTIDASVIPSTSGTVTGAGTYNYGQTCTLTATPNPGYTFLRWTKNGTQVSTNSNYSFTVMESASFVAHFQLNNYVISISSNPSNGGTVSGGGAYHYGDNCTVTATTNYGFNFINWTEDGNTVSNQPSYTFTITSDRNLVANFTTQNYIITVMANPTEGGTVSGSGGYNYGDNCTLSATANTGYVFHRWTKNGMQVSTSPSYSFDVTESATFVAHFTMVDYNISVAANPTEGGNVNGGGTFNYGQICTVQASANIGFVFVNWMENGAQVSDQPTYSFTVTGNRNLVAHFNPLSYEITAEADPEIGGIIVGAGTYPASGTATLNAVPNDSYLFQNWTEGNTIVSELATYTFTVDQSRHLVAHFIFLEGIDESHNAVELFPNPTTDKLYIKGHGIKRLTLFNTLGQLVEGREVEHHNLVILNVSSLKTGVYFIRIVTDQECVSKTFVKKN
jgi:hypothetical protein